MYEAHSFAHSLKITLYFNSNINRENFLDIQFIKYKYMLVHYEYEKTQGTPWDRQEKVIMGDWNADQLRPTDAK